MEPILLLASIPRSANSRILLILSAPLMQKNPRETLGYSSWGSDPSLQNKKHESYTTTLLIPHPTPRHRSGPRRLSWARKGAENQQSISALVRNWPLTGNTS